MAVSAKVSISSLASGLILSPERYDPRRVQLIGGDSIQLTEIVSVESATLSKKKFDVNDLYLVIDTGDSITGFIKPRNSPQYGNEIGSAKKPVKRGDVIISKLRPYLRQVGLVDEYLMGQDFNVVVSTEYYVLRSRKTDDNIAWLVPFLLSDEVQSILCASQEGGHHPRFNKETLSNLHVPRSLMSELKGIGEVIEKNVSDVRLSFESVVNHSGKINQHLS